MKPNGQPKKSKLFHFTGLKIKSLSIEPLNHHISKNLFISYQHEPTKNQNFNKDTKLSKKFPGTGKGLAIYPNIYTNTKWAIIKINHLTKKTQIL